MSPETPSPESASLPGLAIRIAALEEIVDLRDEVIIKGTGRSNPEFDGDRDSDTIHIGAFEGRRTVGCATFLRSVWNEEPAWQLRGMATAGDMRRRGVGAAVLTEAERILRDRSATRLLWCNARHVAVEFYLRQGWTSASDEFPTPGIGMQRKMTKRF